MNEPMETFEAELRRYRPAAPPRELLERLRQEGPGLQRHVSKAAREPHGQSGLTAALNHSSRWLVWRWVRWAVPAACALTVTAWLLLRGQIAPPLSSPAPPLVSTLEDAPVKADAVKIDQELVHSFDTIARLPTGEPVRYRCREWMDQVTLRDRSRGVVVEQRAPRLEVVPVRFETY